MTFSHKNDYRNPKMMTLPDYSHFFVHPLATPFDGHAKCMKPAKTHKLNCNIFGPKKVVPTVFARYNREQLGKYTGTLIATTDPGIRVWYGMIWWFARKMAKPCEGSPLSAL